MTNTIGTAHVETLEKGINEDVVRFISQFKQEPAWMRDFRLKSLQVFQSKPTPKWGPDLSLLEFQEFHYFVPAATKKMRDWDSLPNQFRRDYDRLGVPDAEQ
jgi:Fe-S cluster assembly protein SufB